MADRFQEFNQFVETLHAYPMIRKDQLLDLFRDIDTLIKKGIALILETTHFVEDNVCYQLADIASGTMKVKLYRGRLVTARQSAGKGVMIGSEDTKILGMGFDMFKLSRMARDIAPMLVQRVLRSMRLGNMTYEHILRSFVEATAQYRSLCDQLAEQQIALQQDEQTARTNIITRMKEISRLIDGKEKVEGMVGCVDPNVLYGTVAMVKDVTDRIQKVQQQVLHAYLRLIPREVRVFSRSDSDAKDKFQAGAIGLMYAISKYEFRSGASFVAYARTWIRQRIQYYMKEQGGTMIRLSSKIRENNQKIERARMELQAESELHEEPTIEEIAEHLGWPVAKVKQIQENVNTSYVMALDAELATAINDDEHVEMEAMIPDESIDDQVKQEEHRALIRSIIAPLSPEDKRLVLLKTGVVELLDNHIRQDEALNEVLRQTACKTLLHRMMATRIETVRSLPLEEENEDA